MPAVAVETLCDQKKYVQKKEQLIENERTLHFDNLMHIHCNLFFSLRNFFFLSDFFCSKKTLILKFSLNRTKSPTTKSNSRKVPCTGGKIMIPCAFCDLGEKTLCLKAV